MILKKTINFHKENIFSVLGMILIFLFFVFIYSCDLKNKLPLKFDYKKFKGKSFAEAPVILGYSLKKEMLMFVPIYNDSFFKPEISNYIGLYDKNLEIIDEVEIQAIPVRMKLWSNTMLILYAFTEECNKKHVMKELKKHTSIGKYQLEFKYKN